MLQSRMLFIQLLLFSQTFDYIVRGLHKTVVDESHVSCTCMQFWHSGYCAHVVSLLHPEKVMASTTSPPPKSRGRKRDACSALEFQPPSPSKDPANDSQQFPKPKPLKKKKKTAKKSISSQRKPPKLPANIALRGVTMQ